MTKRKAPEDKLKVGRPTEFDPEKCEQARKLSLLGATDLEIANFFEISEATLYNWKNKFPEFVEAIKNGKIEADARVASRLYDRAMGYEHPDVHISNHQGVITQTPIRKYYPPETTAGIFWLKNRQPEKWRDRKEVTGADGAPLAPEGNGLVDAARRMLFILEGIQK